jgi:hypothetical protein
MTEPEDLIRAMQFNCVTFFDKKLKKQLVLLYALGGDGIIREWNGSNWVAFPIRTSNTVESKANQS